jgi:hypothetical protein
MPDEDAPHHVEVDITAKVDELRTSLAADPEFAATKILRCIELLEAMDKRQLALEARQKVLRGDNTALLLRVDELAVRFETLTGAVQARQPV